MAAMKAAEKTNDGTCAQKVVPQRPRAPPKKLVGGPTYPLVVPEENEMLGSVRRVRDSLMSARVIERWQGGLQGAAGRTDFDIRIIPRLQSVWRFFNSYSVGNY